jgi:hypothetical protein
MTEVIYSVYPSVWKGTGVLSEDGKVITATGETAAYLISVGICIELSVEETYEYQVVFTQV